MTRPSEGFQDATTMRDIYLAKPVKPFFVFFEERPCLHTVAHHPPLT